MAAPSELSAEASALIIEQQRELEMRKQKRTQQRKLRAEAQQQQLLQHQALIRRQQMQQQQLIMQQDHKRALIEQSNLKRNRSHCTLPACHSSSGHGIEKTLDEIKLAIAHERARNQLQYLELQEQRRLKNKVKRRAAPSAQMDDQNPLTPQPQQHERAEGHADPYQSDNAAFYQHVRLLR